MNGKQFRTLVRYIHLGVAILIALYFYMPSANNETMFNVIRFIVIPALIVTGVALWQQPKLLKFIRR